MTSSVDVVLDVVGDIFCATQFMVDLCTLRHV